MDDSITPSNPKYIFTTYDCMGYKVALKTDTLIHKIEPKHPEAKPDLIKHGVESAHWVLQDPDYTNRLRYYTFIPTPIQGRDDITNLKVVVETTSNEYNEVVTAYLIRDLKNESTSGGIIYDAGSASKRGI